MRVRTALLNGLLMLTAVTAITPAMAAANLVTNGDFSAETIGGNSSSLSAQLNGFGGYSGGATLTGWTNTGYSFVFTPGTGTSGSTADTTGATVNQFGGAFPSPNVYITGPGAGGGGVANGFTNSPTGGSFVAADGAFGGPLAQTINNLTVGAQYDLTFYYAAAQQGGFTGATTESWTVNFGNSSFTTPTMTNPSQGFTPWRQQTVSFYATAATQVLSFVAQGAPAGNPPLSLLDGVSLTVPEPASWAAMTVGLLAISFLTFRRRSNRSDAASA